MESALRTAHLAIQSLEEDDFEGLNYYLCDLERTLAGRGGEVKALLREAGAPLAYLRAASRAGAKGDEGLMHRLYRRACSYIGETEVGALVEELRLSLAVQPQLDQPPPALAYCGFVR